MLGSGTYINPIITGDLPDPGAIFVNGSFFVATTGEGFPIHMSVHLDRWSAAGSVFGAGSKPTWAAGDFWAPELHEVNGQFVAYYTARDYNGTLSIGAATSASVLGPFEDIGSPLARDLSASPGMYLDSTYFYDLASSTPYLIWKHGSVTSPAETHTWLYMQQLDSKGTRLVGERHIVLQNELSSWESGVVEAPWLVRPPGSAFYYLFYSGAHCCDGSGSYAVGVARATAVTGPYTKFSENPILHSNRGTGGFDGTGHCSVLPSPADPEKWIIFYHAFTRPQRSGARSLMMDVLSFDATGWPRLTTNTSAPSVGPATLPPTEASVLAQQAPYASVMDGYTSYTILPGIDLHERGHFAQGDGPSSEGVVSWDNDTWCHGPTPSEKALLQKADTHTADTVFAYHDKVEQHLEWFKRGAFTSYMHNVRCNATMNATSVEADLYWYKHCAPGPGVSAYTLLTEKQISTSSCRQECDATASCVAFVMDAAERTCYIMGPQHGFLDHESYFRFPYDDTHGLP